MKFAFNPLLTNYPLLQYLNVTVPKYIQMIITYYIYSIFSVKDLKVEIKKISQNFIYSSIFKFINLLFFKSDRIELIIMNNLILFGVTLFCWSPTWYIIKFQLGYVDPLVSVFYRFLLASIIIFIYLMIKKENLKFSFNYHVWFLYFGVCLYSLNYVFFYLSNTYLISAFPAIVFSTVVIMNILGEAFYFKKKPSLKTLIGASIGMVGIIIIFNDEILDFTLNNDTHIGLFLALIGTFFASTGNMVHQRNLNNNFPVMVTIAYAMLYGSLITLLITQLRNTELLFEYSFSYIASLIYLSIVGSIFAFIFYLKLLKNVGAGRAGYVGVIMPMLALLISTVFENLEWHIDLIVGLPILIIGAILVINQKNNSIN